MVVGMKTTRPPVEIQTRNVAGSFGPRDQPMRIIVNGRTMAIVHASMRAADFRAACKAAVAAYWAF